MVSKTPVANLLYVGQFTVSVFGMSKFFSALVFLEEQQDQQRRREKPWLLRRVTLGHFDTLMQELMRESCGDFKANLRIEPPMFREIMNRLTPRIFKHQGLPAGLRLAITLRFLATGDCRNLAETVR